MKRVSSIWFVMFIAVALLACKLGGKKYEDSAVGLEQLAKDLSPGSSEDTAKLATGLKLEDPAAFFTATFGPELGPKLAADYATETVALATLPTFFSLNQAKGRTQVVIEKLQVATDGNANGYQQAAIAAMKSPVALYTINVVEPGKPRGSSLWSFAHVGGTFRYLGKLKAVKPDGTILDELSAKDVASLGQ